MLSPASVSVQIGVTYQGTGFVPSCKVRAVTHPDYLTPDGLVSGCRGAVGKVGLDSESFRRSLGLFRHGPMGWTPSLTSGVMV